MIFALYTIRREMKRSGCEYRPNNFFPNVRRTELDESTYRKVESTDQYVSSHRPSDASIANETAKCICLRLSQGINPHRVERKQQRSNRVPSAAEHTGIFSSLIQQMDPAFHLFRYLSDADVNFDGNACLGITDDDDEG